MIEVEHLRKTYGELTAVSDVSFVAQPGEIFGLLGPNGAGKTTTIGCMSGLLAPTEGRVRVMGHDIVREPQAAKRALGVAPQDCVAIEDSRTGAASAPAAGAAVVAVPHVVPVPPGPGNPLGTRWMGLSAPGVGIHGTDEPWSIGHSESHGCIRMQVPSAEWLFNRVRVGTPVFIIAA